MHPQIKKIKNLLLFLSIIMLFSSGCTTMGKIWDVITGADEAKKAAEGAGDAAKNFKDLEALGEEDKEKDFTGLKIALLPFNYTTATGYNRALVAYNELAASMVSLNAFKPYSLKEWSLIEFHNKPAKNVQEIVQHAQKKGLAIDFIAHGHVFKSGAKYGLMISVYPVIPGVMPSYYYRPFKNFYSISNVTDEIVKEMEKRFNNTNKPVLHKNIFVNKFRINYYTFTNISSEEGSTISLPYIKIKGVSYKSSDHFFNQLLLYNLHITRLFKVYNANIDRLVSNRPTVPANTDYVINVTIDITKKVSLMKIRVQGRKNNKSFSYSYPFNTLELDSFSAIMKENVKMITLRMISDEEKKQIGLVNLNPVDSFHPVYCDNYYLGSGSQNHLIQPIGTTSISISDEKFKMFISPFGENNKIYRLKNAFLLDSK